MRIDVTGISAISSTNAGVVPVFQFQIPLDSTGAIQLLDQFGVKVVDQNFNEIYDSATPANPYLLPGPRIGHLEIAGSYSIGIFTPILADWNTISAGDWGQVLGRVWSSPGYRWRPVLERQTNVYCWPLCPIIGNDEMGGKSAMGWISVALVLAVGCTPPRPPLVPVPSGFVQSLDYSSDGKLLASTGGNGIPQNPYNLVRIWDQDGKELRRLRGNGGMLNRVQFLPNSTLLVGCAGRDSGFGMPPRVNCPMRLRNAHRTGSLTLPRSPFRKPATCLRPVTRMAGPTSGGFPRDNSSASSPE